MRVFLKKAVFSMGFGLVFSIWLNPHTQAMDSFESPLGSNSPSLSRSSASLNEDKPLRGNLAASKPSLNLKIRELLQDIPSSLEQMTRLESRIQTLILYHAGEINNKGSKASCPRLVMAIVTQKWGGLKTVKKAEEQKYVFKKQNSLKYTDYLQDEKKLLAERTLLIGEVIVGLKKWVYATLKPEEDTFGELKLFCTSIDRWVNSISLQNDTIEDLKILKEMFPKKPITVNEGEVFSETNLEIFHLVKYIFEESLLRRAQVLYERLLPVYLDLKSSIYTFRYLSQELQRENDILYDISQAVDAELKKPTQTPSTSYWFSWRNSKIPHPKVDISPVVRKYGKFPLHRSSKRNAKAKEELTSLDINEDGPEEHRPVVVGQFERLELQEKLSSKDRVSKALAASKTLSALFADIKSLRDPAHYFGLKSFPANSKGGALRQPPVRFAHHLIWTPEAFARNTEKFPGEKLSATVVRYFSHYEQLIEFFNENLKRYQGGYFSQCLFQLERNSTFQEKECPKGRVESSQEKEEREKENYRRRIIAECFFTTDYIEHWILAHYTFRNESEKQYFIDSLTQHLLSLHHFAFGEEYFKNKASNKKESQKLSVEAAKEVLFFRVMCAAIALQKPIPKREEQARIKEDLFQTWWRHDPRVNEALRQVRNGEVRAPIHEEHKALVVGKLESLFRDILVRCLKMLHLDEEKIRILTQEAEKRIELRSGTESQISSNRISSSNAQDEDESLRPDRPDSEALVPGNLTSSSNAQDEGGSQRPDRPDSEALVVPGNLSGSSNAQGDDGGQRLDLPDSGEALVVPESVIVDTKVSGDSKAD